MKKVLKLIIHILLILIILWAIIFITDYIRCTKMKKMPIFVISSETADDGGSGTYYGLGYKIEVKTNISAENGLELESIEMYIFNKFVTGTYAKINSLPINETNYTFRAIVTDCTSTTSLLVTPIEEKDEKMLGDLVRIYLKDNNDMVYMKGTELLISCTGDIMETYPVQINVTDIQTEETYKKNIESLPKDYTLEQAIQDNCVVLIHTKKIYNKDELDRFNQNVKNNIPDFMRVVSFTIEGDMLITDIKYYFENTFNVCFDWTRDEYSGIEDRTYKYCEYSEYKEEKTEDGIYYFVDNAIDGGLGKMYIAGYENDVEIINKGE